MAIPTHPTPEPVRDRERAAPPVPSAPVSREQARRELGFDLIGAERAAGR